VFGTPKGYVYPRLRTTGLKVLDTVKKIGSLSENSAPLVSQAGYGPSLPGCALRNCVVARFLLYGRRDEVHAPLASLFLEKTVK